MANGDIKMEIKPEIKLDPGDSPAAMSDIEQYEDAGDLELPDENSQAWLINVPKTLFKEWNEIYKNAQVGAEFTMGVMRVHPGESNQKIEIIPSEESRSHSSAIASAYEIELRANGYGNTLVFTEKDLPGHRNVQIGAGRFARPNGIQSKSDRYGQQQPRKPGSYRTSIPKRTTLAPLIHHEGVATPVLSDSLVDLERAMQAETNKTEKVAYSNTIRQIQSGGINNGGNLFQIGSLTSRVGAKGNQKKPLKEKNFRGEKTDLIDALQNLFKEYTYWRMNSIKQRVKQPEPFIKEVLDDIAVFIKQGDFANTYKLKPEYAHLLAVQEEMASGVKSETLAPDMPGGVTESSITGDEMDEDEFEDVDVSQQ